MQQHHFARIEPIVGQSLAQAMVAISGFPWASEVVNYLAASGVAHWHAHQAPQNLPDQLYARHGAALGLQWQQQSTADWLEYLTTHPPDLLILIGMSLLHQQAMHRATDQGIPVLLISEPTQAAIQAFLWWQNPADQWWERVLPATTLPASFLPDHWQTSAPLIAGIARAVLLRHTAYARADLEQLWQQGRNCITLEGNHPFQLSWDLPTAAPALNPVTHFRSPASSNAACAIIGAGSLGSVAAHLLAPRINTFVLIDPDQVEPVNPARQAYLQSDLGHFKTDALAEYLRRAGATAYSYPLAITHEAQLEAILQQHSIQAALVATGSNADFVISRVLRQHHIPHLVGRCYPRARYWEAILVDGSYGPPFEHVRSQTARGPAAPPTPEQIAAYSDLGALEAEPATLIESGWAAAWMARMLYQLIQPPGLRERWILELLADQATCILGGVQVEDTPTGPAYAIDLPGRIWAHHQNDIGKAEYDKIVI